MIITKPRNFKELEREIKGMGKDIKEKLLPPGRKVPLEQIKLTALEGAVFRIAVQRERDGEWPSLRIDEHGIHRTKQDLETNYGMRWDFYWYGTREIKQAIFRLYGLKLIKPRLMGECASLSRRGRKLLEMEEARMVKRA